MWHRIVSVEYAGRAGAGCVVAPGVILTARHLVEYEAGYENEPRMVQISNHEGDGPRVHAELAWQRGQMALLRCRPRDLGQEFPPVRWGEPACSKPPAPGPECSAVGLPHEAMLRLFGEPAVEEGRFVPPQSVTGRIDNADNASHRYSLQADHQMPAHMRADGDSPWTGMAGAAVFCGQLLIGAVAQPPAGWSHGRVEVVPARQLLEDRTFCDIIAAAAGGTRPRLEPADLAGLFDGPPQPAAAASYLLSARSEAADFLGLDAEIGALSSWCATSHSVDVAVLQGRGGSGKTRLSAELARRMCEPHAEAEGDPGGEDMPWTAGFLSETPAWHPAPYGTLRHLTRPALIVIDDAEGRLEQVEELLSTLRGHHAPPGQRIRVLLTARSIRGWWEELRGRHPDVITGTEVVLSPGAVYRQYTPSQVQELAELAFSRRILALHRAGVRDDWDAWEAADRRAALPARTADGTEHGSGGGVPGVLAVHMDALAGVLLQSPGEPTDGHPATATLLDHELQYVRRGMAQAGPAGVAEELLRTLITVQSMAGAQDKEEADAVVRTAWDFHHRDQPCPLDADTLLGLRRAAGELYPALDGGYFATVSPAALTAALIERAEEESGGAFLDFVLPSPALSPHQRRQCLAVIARTVSAQPHLLEGATSAIAAHGDVLARPAAGIARQLPEPWQVAWLKAIEKASPERAAEMSTNASPATGPGSPGGAGRETDGKPARVKAARVKAARVEAASQGGMGEQGPTSLAGGAVEPDVVLGPVISVPHSGAEPGTASPEAEPPPRPEPAPDGPAAAEPVAAEPVAAGPVVSGPVVSGTVMPPPPSQQPQHEPTPLPPPLIGETLTPTRPAAATPHPHAQTPHARTPHARSRSQRFWDSVNTAGALQLLVMITIPLTVLVSVIWIGRSTT